MSKDNFLCTACRRELCDDCKSIADEYAELLTLRTRALIVAEHNIAKLTQELEAAKRQVEMWEQLKKLGLK